MQFFGTDINMYVFFVGSVLSYFLGALWYSPLLFGKIWMKLRGVKIIKALDN
jgi:hypothetical protein